MNILRAQVPWQKIEDQVVIIEPKQQEAFELNPIASFIWENIKVEGTDSQDILAAMTEEFDVDENTAEGDLGEFIKELSEAQLIAEKNV